MVDVEVSRVKATCAWDAVAPAMFSMCMCSRARSAAAATGAFTGSLGWNTSEDRDTHARPRTPGDQGGRWAQPSSGRREEGGGDGQAEGDRDQAGQCCWNPLSISQAPGEPAEPRREQWRRRRRSARPAHEGSKAQQPGGCICSAWTTPQLPSLPLFIEMKER